MNEQEQFKFELNRCLVAVKSQVNSIREKVDSGDYLVELPESFLTLFETARAYAGLVDSELALQFCQFDAWARYRSNFLNHVISEFEEWLEWLALIAKNDSPTLFYWWQKRLFSLDFADRERRKHNDWQQYWRWHWVRATKVLELLAYEAVEFGVNEAPCFELSAHVIAISSSYECEESIGKLDAVYNVAKGIEIRKNAKARAHQIRDEQNANAVKIIQERLQRGEIRFPYMDEGVSEIETHSSSKMREPVQAKSQYETIANQAPPEFDPKSTDWIMGGELSKMIKLTTTIMSDYRKSSEFESEDDNGSWGIDAIGTYRRRVSGNLVAYYIPSLKPMYQSRYTHYKENMGGS